MQRVSIRKQLFTLFVPFLFGLWIITAVVSLWLASTFSVDLFDRDLINSADSVVGRLRYKEGQILVDLPPAAQAILKRDESDRFYYRVLDSSGRKISGDGDGDVPAPAADLQIDSPKVASAKISGRTVRLAEVKVALEEAQGQPVIVQVAETTNARRHFQEKMLLSIVVPQVLLTIVGLCAVWYGLAKILKPLRSLQVQLAERSESDLSALSDYESPEEVFPLVQSMNNVFGRLREDIAARQRFVTMAAHQLRTPLAGLKTYSSIGSEMSDAGELKHVVNELNQGIDRASRIVTQLLALARTDSADPSIAMLKNQTDLNFVVSDAVAELIEQAVLKKIDLHFEQAQRPVLINADQTGLKHLVTNLIENAILYTPAGGNILVRLKQEVHVTLSVIDTGAGIAFEEREKVFERFYRTVGTKGNGSGLGLSIVKEVAHAHNAEVRIESGPKNKGTAVIVEFRNREN